MKNYAIVLAAGLGSRMKVDEPKCIHPIIKRPMIQYIINAIDAPYIDEKIVVIGINQKDKFVESIDLDVTYEIQDNQLGTGHAARCCISHIKSKGHTLIVPGDMPLISKDEIAAFFNFHLKEKNDVSVLSTFMDDPTNYGRIIRNNEQIVMIKEQEYLSLAENQIKEVNTGIYLIKNELVNELLTCNDLPTIVSNALALNFKVNVYKSENSICFIDVNDFYTLSKVEKIIRHDTNKRFLLNGVNIISPETVTIASNVKIESGVTIYPNTFLTGNTIVYKGAIIGPDSEIHNSIIDENAIIRHSLVTDSFVGKNTTVGPFAHLRNNTSIGDNCRVGNYVEIKNSIIGNFTKIAHLTYIGDTKCGENVNWGCGSVTVNYDGKYKNKTIVGDNVFIGCNTNLIAPLTIGNNAFIAAGSTITENIPDEAFSIARERQVTKEDYAKKYNK